MLKKAVTLLALSLFIINSTSKISSKSYALRPPSGAVSILEDTSDKAKSIHDLNLSQRILMLRSIKWQLFRLNSFSSPVRAEARKKLQDMSPYSIPYLIDALGKRRKIRDQAKEILTAIGTPAIPALLKADAYDVLLDADYPRATRSLIDALDSKNFYVSYTASEVLARIKDPASVEPLKGVLTSGGFGADHAADALGNIGDPSTFEALRRVKAVSAIAKIKHPQRFETLMSFVGQKNLSLSRTAEKALMTLASIK